MKRIAANAKTKRNHYIAKKVLAYRKRKNPVPILAKKFGITKVRIYKIVQAYEKEQGNN